MGYFNIFIQLWNSTIILLGIHKKSSSFQYKSERLFAQDGLNFEKTKLKVYDFFRISFKPSELYFLLSLIF